MEGTAFSSGVGGLGDPVEEEGTREKVSNRKFESQKMEQLISGCGH